MCKCWQTVLYSDQRFWTHLTPLILCNELRREKSFPSLLQDINEKEDQMDGSEQTEQNELTLQSNNGDLIEEIKANLYYSIDIRGFDSICLLGATDGDIVDFTGKVTPRLMNRLTSAALRNASVSDKGLEVFLASLSTNLYKLELSGIYQL